MDVDFGKSTMRNAIIIIFTLFIMLFFSCAKKQTLTGGMGSKCLKEAPAWVIQGAAAKKEGGGTGLLRRRFR